VIALSHATARGTLRFMDAQRPATCRTNPPLLLARNKLSDAGSLDHEQIVDDAHAVVGSVANIQMP
jgi:hypothetical protein